MYDFLPSPTDRPNDQARRKADALDIYVGQQLKKRRTELGLSQKDIADPLGISYQQIQKYETGNNRVSAGRLYMISRIIDYPLEAFFPSAGTEFT